MIKARWNDGYKFDDFKTVIDNKSFEWQGTDFWKFMRPKTLFSASHFDDYLNEKHYVDYAVYAKYKGKIRMS